MKTQETNGIEYKNRTVTLTGDVLEHYKRLADASGQTVEGCVIEGLKDALNRQTIAIDLMVDPPGPGEFSAVAAASSNTNQSAVGYRDGKLVHINRHGVERPITLKESLRLVLQIWVADLSAPDVAGFDDWARCRWLEQIHAALA